MITQEHFDELDKLLKAAVENPELLSEWENDFASDWVDKLGEKETKVVVSDKQQGIFDRMRSKLERGGAL